MTASLPPRLPSPYVSTASYWRPTRLITSDWFEHAPFAAWLLDALRPRALVELGTSLGFSMFAFAEFADRLGLDTRMFALDTWGHEDAGVSDDAVFELVRTVVSEQFPHRVELVRGPFSDSASRFDDGTIDLLHLDGRHGYEEVKADFETYLPKVSARGVVLFHNCYEFGEGFGVHRLWREVAGTWPSFRFQHGRGLGIIAVGDEVPREVLSFLEYANENEDEVFQFYAAEGARVREEYLTRSRAGRASELERELAELRASTSWRLTAPLRSISGLRRR